MRTRLSQYKCVVVASMLFLSMLLSGCNALLWLIEVDKEIDEFSKEEQTFESSQCPAFYHPEFSNWIPEEAEDNVISFSDSSGTTALFTAGILFSNEPYTLSGSDAGLSCRLTAQRNYPSSSLYPQIDYEYLHIDTTTAAIADEPLQLTLKIKTNEGEPLPQQFQIYLETNSGQDGVNQLYETMYFPSYTIGINEYSHVISQTAQSSITGLLVDDEYPAETKIIKVLIARGVGLVQFELADGRVFNRNL